MTLAAVAIHIWVGSELFRRDCSRVITVLLSSPQSFRLFDVSFLLYGRLAYERLLVRMDEVVHRLLIYAVSNGILTTIGSFLAMIFVSYCPLLSCFHELIFFRLLQCHIISFSSPHISSSSNVGPHSIPMLKSVH